MKESIAGTIRMEAFPSFAVDVGAAGTVAVVVVTGTGDDSALRREVFCVASTCTSIFIGVWPCRSRNVGDDGDALPVSAVLIGVAARELALVGGAAEPPLVGGLLAPVTGMRRDLMLSMMMMENSSRYSLYPKSKSKAGTRSR